ncbi:MAG: tRNA (adenosine(37)-N6)-threonylcarbamoyltransferase complex ATPase subunit type 1 TsaE [Muribaculaceae bacterium]|nr:tRNA (adenosine(37)-N6)-threonylcarbamoyltransferase complex ATPase subunit type 1 TsaE [Muribaculaceae bacterium]
MKITIPSPETLPQAAAQFVEAMKGRTLFSFNAPMGAGKTTFIAAVCKALKMADEASSPTFSIVNEYHADPSEKTPFGKIFHFDFYRIETPEDALDLGLDDYFDSGVPCLMEWAENIGSLLPEETVEVTIDVDQNGVRTVSFDE